MYYTDEDTVTISACSCDLGDNISKGPMEISVCATHGKIQSQPLDLPDDWKMPSQPFVRFCFSQLLLITLGKPDLEELWQYVSQWNRLDERIKRINNPMVGLSTMICVLLVHVAYVLILEYSIQTADRSSKESCKARMNTSAYLLLAFVCCRWISRMNSGYMVIRRVWDQKPGKVKVFVSLALTRMAEFLLAFSHEFLVSCGLVFFLGENYWMSFVGACTFGFLLDAVMNTNMQTAISRGALTFFLWFGVAFSCLMHP